MSDSLQRKSRNTNVDLCDAYVWWSCVSPDLRSSPQDSTCSLGLCWNFIGTALGPSVILARNRWLWLCENILGQLSCPFSSGQQIFSWSLTVKSEWIRVSIDCVNNSICNCMKLVWNFTLFLLTPVSLEAFSNPHNHSEVYRGHVLQKNHRWNTQHTASVASSECLEEMAAHSVSQQQR